MQFVSPKPNGNNIGKAGDCETNFCYKRLKEVNVPTNSDNEHEKHGENGADADDEDVLIDRQTLNKGYKSKWQQRNGAIAEVKPSENGLTTATVEENNALKKQNQSEKSEAKSSSELDDQQDSGDTVVETASSRDRLHLTFDAGTTRGRFGVQHGNHNFAKRVYDKIRQIFHFQQPKSVGESTSTKRKKNGVTFFVGSPAQSPLSPGAAIRPPSICSDLLISASLSSYSIVRQPLQRALSCGSASGKRERNASGFNRRRSNSSRRSRTSILAEQTMPTIEEHDGAIAVVSAELSNEQREQPKKMPNTVVDNKQQAERVTLNGQQENEERICSSFEFGIDKHRQHRTSSKALLLPPTPTKADFFELFN